MEGHRELEDALSFINQVQCKLGKQSQIFADFLDIMKEVKSESIDRAAVIQRVSHLFREHPDLIVGFCAFLPLGCYCYKLEIHRNEQVQVSVPEKNIASCSTQRDVSERFMDTENFEDEDLSSLNSKDGTLLAEGMKELLSQGSDHDLKIVVKGKEFRAHRNILRTRSPVFAVMLTHDSKESSTGTISIEDCDPDSFDEFLLYLYSGSTGNLSPSKALQLYQTADKYNLPVLKKRCAILLKTSLSVTSVCDVILLAAKHGDKKLLEVATEFFGRNVREVVETVRWKEFVSKNPDECSELIKSSILLPRK